MTPPCLYSVGDRVRLANPDNPRHPARGKAGVVIETHYREPKSRWERGVPRQTVPGAWFVEILVRKATAEDWQRYRTISETWILLETEVEFAI